MDYEKMSNEELYDQLTRAFPTIGFRPVADDNRQYIIDVLKALDERRELKRRK